VRTLRTGTSSGAEKSARRSSKKLARVLADNVRALRLARRLSQEDLAELCGLHRTYLGSVERSERNVTLSTLEALAEGLGVRVADLLIGRRSGSGRSQF